MNIETIRKVINNSTWVSNENNTIFEFSNGKDLSINGKNHLQYSLSFADNRVVIQMGVIRKYYVDFINDFTLCLYNDNEKFRISPE
jgi:hypothetical protein